MFQIFSMCISNVFFYPPWNCEIDILLIHERIFLKDRMRLISSALIRKTCIGYWVVIRLSLKEFH